MTGIFGRAVLVLGFVVFSGALLTGCENIGGSKGSESPDLNSTIAEVGARKVTLGDLEHEVKRYKTLFKITDDQGRDQGEALRKAILTRLIDNLVLEVEADRLAITVSDSDLETEVASLLGKYDTARLGLILTENEMSYDEWEKSLIERIRTRKLTVKEIDSNITVSEEEIKEYFQEHASEFLWPMRVRALQIMVGDEAKAEKIRKRLVNKADFATIAKETSQSPDAASGGDLGYFSRGQMPPEFEEAVFNLKEGEISEVIKSIYGFHIFKVIKKKKLRPMKYNEAHERIRTLIFEKKREEVFVNWTKKLKKRVKIKVYPFQLSSASQ
ncbi:Foldase protein PrsA precursor [hydrothermal vent metagenome]|uniref:peptidylprolyl isomerase n=1 Tax=hydrothermal vent metagenome TaxID=652676 RepID=A0A3B1CEP4_9ZZZZ